MSWEDEIQDLQQRVEKIREALGSREAEATAPLQVPPVAEFVVRSDFLGKGLFPRQATLLKILFLEWESMTAFDIETLNGWGSGFELGEFDSFLEGRWFEPTPDRPFAEGTTPDVRDRMDVMRAAGRTSFRHFNFVAGRRAGKGELASDAVAYLLWKLLALHEPQPRLNAARGKVLTVDVFAATHQQARETVFADIVRTVVGAPCFAPFVVKVTRDRLVLATPFDRSTGELDRGTIEVVARETTLVSGRGQASVCQVYDEMAWVEPATSRAAADELFASATPALDQARGWAMILTLSSPYTRTGEFYRQHRLACEVDIRTGEALYPEQFTVQLPSWAPYLDAERAVSIPIAPFGVDENEWNHLEDGSPRCFTDPGGAPIVDDHELRQKERADPVRFRVESGAQWADVANPFLLPKWIDDIFGGLEGVALEAQHRGHLSHDYVIHVDASSKSDPTAYAIAHAITIGEERFAVIDRTRRWVPRGGVELSWEEIYDQLEEDIRAFWPSVVSTDQYAGTFLLTEMKRRLGRDQRRVHFETIHHTRSLNIELGATLRQAAMHGRLKAYPDRQAKLELSFLEDDNGQARAPTTGPVTTDDVAVCIMIVVQALLGSGAETLAGLSKFGLTALPGTNAYAGEFSQTGRSAGRRQTPISPARGTWRSWRS